MSQCADELKGYLLTYMFKKYGKTPVSKKIAGNALLFITLCQCLFIA